VDVGKESGVKQRRGRYIHTYVQGGPKSKPLPNDHKIVLNRIKACQWH